MRELISNPAVQAGLAPFFVALIAGWLLKRLGWYWTGLCIALGFIAAVYLITGIQFTPLTSTRKIVLLGLSAIAVGMLLDLYPYKRSWIRIALFSAGIAAVMWVIWPGLIQRHGYSLFALAAGSSLYVGWMAASMESLREQPLRAANAVLALGLGTGAAALFGASALLAQLGIALGAAGGAFWLLSYKKDTYPGSLGTLPTGLLAGLIGVAAHVYAKLPGYSLAMLALIPLLVRIPLPRTAPRWLQAVIPAMLSFCAAIAAVWWARKVLGNFSL